MTSIACNPTFGAWADREPSSARGEEKGDTPRLPWARSVAIPASEALSSPEARGRIASADIVFAIDETDEIVAALKGASLLAALDAGHDLGPGAPAIAVVAVEGEQAETIRRLRSLIAGDDRTEESRESRRRIPAASA